MMLSLMTAAALAATPVSLEFDGPLEGGLKQLAQESGLNLVVIGALDERVSLHLPQVDGEEALEAIAQAYGLEVTRSTKVTAGRLWVVRRAAPRSTAPGGRAAPDEASEAPAPREEAEAAAAPARAQAPTPPAQAELVSTGGPVTVAAGTAVEAAVAYGGPVIVEENARVDGDAVSFGGDVQLKKGAVVNGNAVAFGGSVVREDGAVVRGGAVSMGGSAIGAAVAQEMAKASSAIEAPDGDDEPSARGVAGFLAQFAVLFGLGFVLMLAAPQRMKVLEAAVTSRPGLNGLVGLLGFLATIPLTIMLSVTIVGIPVAIAGWLGLALVVPVGLAAIANALGARVPTGRLRKTQALALALGLLALLLLSRVPVLGQLSVFLASLVSLGAILRTRLGQGARGTPMLDPVREAAA